MKKSWIAGIVALVLSVLCLTPVRAQNIPNSYFAAGIGNVSFAANSGGSYYGQWFNSASGSSWSLGFGTSKDIPGTPVFTWTATGSSGTVSFGTTSSEASLVVASTSASSGSPIFLAEDNNGNNLVFIYNDGAVQFKQLTKAQLTAKAPNHVGDMFSCSDCTLTYTVVVATGTGTNQWRVSGLATGVQ